MYDAIQEVAYSRSEWLDKIERGHNMGQNDEETGGQPPVAGGVGWLPKAGPKRRPAKQSQRAPTARLAGVPQPWVA